MKTKLIYLALIAALTLSCKSKNKPDEPQPVDRPTWTVSAEADRSHNMTIVLALPDTLDSNINIQSDLIGVFSGDHCLAVAPFTKSGAGNRAMLVVTGPSASMSKQLDLKYYSANAKRLYVSAQPIPYEPNNRFGSTDVPYYTTWKRQ